MILSSSSLSQNSENKPSLELRSKIKATETELALLIQEASFQKVIRKVKNDSYLSRTELEVGELKNTLKELYSKLFDADEKEVTKAKKALAVQKALPYLASDDKLLPRIKHIEGMMSPPVLTEATTHAVTGSLLELPKSDLEKHVANLKLKLSLLYEEVLEGYPTKNVKSEILKLMKEIEMLKQNLSSDAIKNNKVIQNLYNEWELLLHVKA
ncbi:MAG: hypothetical protein ACK5T0_01525 [Vampirovibrionales bacterium]